MRRVVAHPQGARDHGRHALGCPQVAAEAAGFGAAGQERGQLRPLLGRQLGPAARRGMPAQGLGAPGAGPLEPLAHRALRHAQRLGDPALRPTLLRQLPGAAPAIFSPVGWLAAGVLSHAPPHRTSQTTFSNLCCAR